MGEYTKLSADGTNEGRQPAVRRAITTAGVTFQGDPVDERRTARRCTTGRSFGFGNRLDVRRYKTDPWTSKPEECPLSPRPLKLTRSGLIEAALRGSISRGVFEPAKFKKVTAEEYYSVHVLCGSILCRAVERAATAVADLEEACADLDQLLALLHDAPVAQEDASVATYEHHGLHTIHVVHLAASLGSVRVLERLKAHYGEAIINRRSTIQRVRVELGSPGSDHLERQVSEVCEHYTCLLSAVYMSRTDAVLWLLNNGADANIANVDGQTALHILARNGLRGESNGKQDEACERLTQKLVQWGADLDARSGSDNKKLGDWLLGKTPLELAASKGSTYPKHLLHLLARSFHKPEQAEPLKEVTLISRVNPAAAENLMEYIRGNRLVRKQLLLEVHTEGQHVENLVEVLRTAAPAAATLLDMLTFQPQVKSLQKNPLPQYSWLENEHLQCAYEPDARAQAELVVDASSPQVAIPPLPIWDFDVDRGAPPWQAKFSTVSLNPLTQDKVYEVMMRVVHVPDILQFKVAHALYSLREQPRHMEIFRRAPIQAIIEGFWASARPANRLNLGIEVLVMVQLLLLGLGPHRYGLLPVPGSIVIAKALFDVVNMISTACLLARRIGSTWWSHFCSPGVVFELSCCVLLASLATSPLRERLRTSAASVEGRWRVLVAMNVFARFCCVVRQLRSQRGFGDTIISVQKSVPKTWNMILFMTLVFVNFSCIFLILKDEDRGPEFILLYLWLALIFGEGDGIESISGFDTQHATYEGGGSHFVVQASIIFMAVASFLFAVVLMNLMIAIYSNYYEEMVPAAPLHFQKMRAKECACYMLRPSFPSRLVRRAGARWCRAGSLLGAALLLLLWLQLLSSGLPWRGALLLMFAWQLVQAVLLLDAREAGARRYLWVCFRSDFDEVWSGGEARWQQRHLRGELGTLQRSVDDLSRQVTDLQENLRAVALHSARPRRMGTEL